MSKNCYFVLLVVSLCILLAGCASSDVANRYYSRETFPPKPPEEVLLLYEKPARDYVVIADFQSRGEKPKKIRKKAAQIGADAVIVSLLGGYYDTGSEWAEKNKQSDYYTRIVGTAIKFK